MNRISRILGTPTNESQVRLGSSSFFSGFLAMLLIAAGLASLGAGCANNSSSEREEEPRTFTRSDYMRAKKKLDGMVAAGEASQEDADIRLSRMRRAIASDRSGESRTFTRAEYARAKKKIDGMVAEGKVSREDADTRLGQMRRMIARTAAAPEGDKPEEFDWAGVKERIEGAVEAGEITREEADARYAGIKKRLDGSEAQAAAVRSRLDYANAEAKIKAMVEAGEVSAEDAKKRLNRMRERISGGDRGERGKESRTFTKEEYEAAEKKIKAMVDEGKVNAEDAEKRLNRMRQAMDLGDQN